MMARQGERARLLGKGRTQWPAGFKKGARTKQGGREFKWAGFEMVVIENGVVEARPSFFLMCREREEDV